MWKFRDKEVTVVSGQSKNYNTMPPASRADQKAAVDAAAWMFNVVTSVGIILVNKALMAKYGFSFGKISL